MASQKQKNKMRDMARSVLPSTGRKGARDNKRLLKQQHRTRTKQTLSEVKTLVDPDEAPAQLIFDTYHANNGIAAISWDNMAEIVDIRRGGDKLGPLLRWANTLSERELKDLSDSDKYAWFKNALPDTLQGRHALSHIKTDLGLYEDPFRYGWWRGGREQKNAKKELIKVKERLRAKLNWIVRDAKRHARYVEMLREEISVVGHRTDEVLYYEKTYEGPALYDENGAFRRDFLGRVMYAETKRPVYKLAQCDDCKFRNWDGMHIEDMVSFLVRNTGYERPKGMTRWQFSDYLNRWGHGRGLLDKTLRFE